MSRIDSDERSSIFKNNNKNDYNEEITLHHRRVLIVDDVECNRTLIEQMLRKIHRGFEATHAGNGQEAVQLVQSGQKFDLIFMDTKMPVMNGIEATKKIVDIYPNLIVIGITGVDDPQDIAECRSAGMDEVIVKPIIYDHFCYIVAKYIDELQSIRSQMSDNIVGEPINYELLHRISHGSSEIFDLLIQSYVRNLSKLMVDLQKAVDALDKDKTLDIVHSIRGASSQVGAEAINELVKKIEKCIKEGDCLGCHIHLMSLNEVAEATITRLKNSQEY